MPKETLKIKYAVDALLTSFAFGDTYRIHIQSSENKKTQLLNEADLQQSYRMHSVQKSKFNKKERTYFLKQASVLMTLDENQIGVSKLTHFYMSTNNIYMIYNEAQLNGQTAPNLFDYLINRDKALNMNELRYIAIDLMQSLQYLNNKGVAHLDLSPHNILVIYDFDKYN